jgi:hypothetical protein
MTKPREDLGLLAGWKPLVLPGLLGSPQPKTHVLRNKANLREELLYRQHSFETGTIAQPQTSFMIPAGHLDRHGRLAIAPDGDWPVEFVLRFNRLPHPARRFQSLLASRRTDRVSVSVVARRHDVKRCVR